MVILGYSVCRAGMKHHMPRVKRAKRTTGSFLVWLKGDLVVDLKRSAGPTYFAFENVRKN